jgi:type I restriction enzyme S subunit
MNERKNLPDRWKEESFINCIDNKTSNKFKIPQNGFQTDGKYPIIDQGAKFIAGYTDNSEKIYKGDLPVIIFGDHTRIFKFIDFQFALGADGTQILLPKMDKLIPKYLYFFLRGLKIESHGYSRHYKFLKRKKIIIPPLPVQKKIVSVLEKAEKLKQKREEADNLTHDYPKSVFYEMFGNPKINPKNWNLVPTQDLFDMKLGKMLSAKNYTGKCLKSYLRNINVQWGYLDLKDVKQMDFDEKEFPKYLLRNGDILVCEGGEVGRTAIYKGEIKDCCYQNALHRLRIKNREIEPLYFVYFMFFASKCGLLQRETIQATIAHFTEDKFKKFKIMLPPLSKQKKFAKIVERLEKIEEKQKHSKETIDGLFDDLMQKAFKGELIC